MKEKKIISVVLAGAMAIGQCSFMRVYADGYDTEVICPVIIPRSTYNEITFKNPQDSDFAHAAIYRVEDDGTQRYLGNSRVTDRHWKSSGYTDGGLENNRRYTYAVKAVNKNGEESTGVLLSAVPRVSFADDNMYMGWKNTIPGEYSWAGVKPTVGKDSSIGMVLHTANGSGNNNAAAYTQVGALKKNTTYRLSYDVKYDDADSYQSFAVKCDGKWYKDRQYADILPEESSVWERKEFDFTTGDTADGEIGFAAFGFSLNRLIIDNVELVEIKGGAPIGQNLIQNGDFEVTLPEIENVHAVGGDGKIILTWTNPQSENVQYVRVFVDNKLVKEVNVSDETFAAEGLNNKQEYLVKLQTANDWDICSAGISMTGKAGRILTRPNVIKDDISNRVVGIDESMEYSSDGGNSWIRYDATNPPQFDGDVDVEVRYANDGTAVDMEVQMLHFSAEGENTEITVDKIHREGGTISIKGHLKSGFGKRITAQMVRVGGNRRFIGDIAAVKQVRSGADGTFEIDLHIADSKKDNTPTDGKYNIYINNESDDLYTLPDITFAGSDARAAAINAMHDTSLDFKNLLAAGSPHYDGLVSIGFDLDMLYNNSPSVYNNVLDFLEKERASVTENNAEKIFYTAYILGCANKSGDKEQLYMLLKNYNAETTMLSFKDTTAEELFSDEKPALWICEYMVSGAECTDTESLNKKFGQGYVIWQINKSNYYNMAALLKENETLLDLAGDAWNYYRNLADNSSEQYEASKKIIEKRSQSAFKTTADIINAIPSAGTINPGGQGTGGNGGGTGGGGGTSSTKTDTGFIPPIKNSGLSLDEIFYDVPKDMWARAAIEYLYSKGIVGGVGENKFEPYRTVKREEFVRMLVSACGLYDAQAICGFSDIEPNHWSAPYIASAVNAGIVSGIDENNFGLGRLITREEMAVMIMRCRQLKGGEDKRNETTDFTDDADISSYAKESVYRAREIGIISGLDDGRFAPKMNASRAEAAMMLYRYIQKGDF